MQHDAGGSRRPAPGVAAPLELRRPRRLSHSPPFAVSFSFRSRVLNACVRSHRRRLFSCRVRQLAPLNDDFFKTNSSTPFVSVNKAYFHERASPSIETYEPGAIRSRKKAVKACVASEKFLPRPIAAGAAGERTSLRKSVTRAAANQSARVISGRGNAHGNGSKPSECRRNS